ncbi:MULTISPECIES: DUF2948 family protein [unclassified Bosea (in: a-proteobacteria)]|uniref:DUF2948 family protein n=1 Tax=unclassified Bosea (in: a-proteobacteria) TaxID=2653178 RepID=UPI000953FE9F|nr:MULTISPECIES: DUF2948 family protein [unclassified Bosea (in: a-proteobacteria)]TAJ27736.1 MAG: DUF2948 family protein [Bosea sp. (in: a-proteobacteria)]SIQ11333.1 Protein of unknown function [Bosea sp. TND4EK4]
MSDAAADPLKLLALDADDLGVVSAHLQDAVLKIADMVYLPKEHRFALAARRFDWEGAEQGHRRRRLAALHFDRVLGVRSSNLDKNDAERVLNLLAVTFEATQEPAGEVTLHFSEGAAIRLVVECIESQMKDLGPVWEAVATPDHPES